MRKFEKIPAPLATGFRIGRHHFFGGIVRGKDGENVLLVLQKVGDWYYAIQLPFLYTLHAEAHRIRRHFEGRFRPPKSDRERLQLLDSLLTSKV